MALPNAGKHASVRATPSAVSSSEAGAPVVGVAPPGDHPVGLEAPQVVRQRRRPQPGQPGQLGRAAPAAPGAARWSPRTRRASAARPPSPRAAACSSCRPVANRSRNGPRWVIRTGSGYESTTAGGSALTKNFKLVVIAACADRVVLARDPARAARGLSGSARRSATAAGAVARHGSRRPPPARPSPAYVVARVEVGHQPCGILGADGKVWVSIYGDDTSWSDRPREPGAVERSDPDRRAQPCGLAFGAGSIWVEDYGSDEVTRVIGRRRDGRGDLQGRQLALRHHLRRRRRLGDQLRRRDRLPHRRGDRRGDRDRDRAVRRPASPPAGGKVWVGLGRAGSSAIDIRDRRGDRHDRPRTRLTVDRADGDRVLGERRRHRGRGRPRAGDDRAGRVAVGDRPRTAPSSTAEVWVGDRRREATLLVPDRR